VGASQAFNVFLAQNSSGVPGSFIEQIGFDVSASGGEVTVNSIATPITLTGGTPYWLVLTPASTNTYIYWDNGGSSLVQYAILTKVQASRKATMGSTRIARRAGI
jgi:hypothetical protein